MWTAARARDFLITTDLKANRSLRVPDPHAERGWRWQQVSDYAAGLTADDFILIEWPRHGDGTDDPRQVYIHVVQMRVLSLYRCQLVIARPALDAPASATRYWASSDRGSDVTTLLGHIAARWDVDVFFSDTKDLLGLDQIRTNS